VGLLSKKDICPSERQISVPWRLKGTTPDDSLALLKRQAVIWRKYQETCKMVARNMKNIVDETQGEKQSAFVEFRQESPINAFSVEEELTASDLAHFNYTPNVSADVERSFSSARMCCRKMGAHSPSRI
jgi:hypothetical protein